MIRNTHKTSGIKQPAASLAVVGLLSSFSGRAFASEVTLDHATEHAEVRTIAGKFKVSSPARVASVQYAWTDLVGENEGLSDTDFDASVGGLQGVTVGWAATEHWIVGLQGHYSTWKRVRSSSSTRWAVGPELSFVFDPSGAVQPFVGASAGLSGTSTESPFIGSQRDGGVFAGLHAGTLLKVVDGLSIDPTVALDYQSARSLAALAGLSAANSQRHSIALSGLVALTAWL